MPHPTDLLFEKWEGPVSHGGENHLTKASTAITKGRMLAIDSNGYVVHAVSGDRFLGIAEEDKSASDATTAPILINFVRKGDVLRGTSDAALTQTMVGEEVDLKADGTVDVGVSTNDDFNVFNIMGSAVTDILVTCNKTYF